MNPTELGLTDAEYDLLYEISINPARFSMLMNLTKHRMDRMNFEMQLAITGGEFHKAALIAGRYREANEIAGIFNSIRERAAKD